MKTNLFTLTNALGLSLLVLATMSTGCASNGCSGGGLFGGSRVFQNQPVRSTLRSWFQGDQCDTCNAPAGQVTAFSPNVAPMCDSCNTGQPIGSPATPLYGSPIGGAQLGSPQLQPQPGTVGGDAIGNGVNPPSM